MNARISSLWQQVGEITAGEVCACFEQEYGMTTAEFMALHRNDESVLGFDAAVWSSFAHMNPATRYVKRTYDTSAKVNS